MGAFAQFERDLISDRTKQSLQAKKLAGVVLGKPRTISDETRAKAVELHRKGKSMRAIASELGVGLTAVHRFVKESK